MYVGDRDIGNLIVEHQSHVAQLLCPEVALSIELVLLTDADLSSVGHHDLLARDCLVGIQRLCYQILVR